MEWNLSEKLIGAIIGFGGIGLLYWAELWRMYKRHAETRGKLGRRT